MGIFDFFKNRRNRVKKGDIMKTTDGFLRGNPDNTKERRVVVFDKRKDDGALAVSKIHKKRGQNPNNYIQNLDLQPNKHSSLTETSVIEKRVVFGLKDKNNNYTPIFIRDLQKTNDKLNFVERYKHKKGAGGDTRQHKRTLKNTTKRWKKHFRT